MRISKCSQRSKSFHCMGSCLKSQPTTVFVKQHLVIRASCMTPADSKADRYASEVGIALLMEPLLALCLRGVSAEASGTGLGAWVQGLVLCTEGILQG